MTIPGAFSREFAQRKDWKLQPGLLEAILATVPPGATILEAGAGIGRYVAELRSRGHVCWGVDGIEGIEELSDGLVRQADLTTALSWANGDSRPQWCLSFEVGEHIPAELADRYLDNVAYAASDGLMVSWAVVGQPGRNHIHCQLPEWVSCELGKRRWTVDTPATLRARQIAGKGWDKKLLVFKR